MKPRGFYPLRHWKGKFVPVIIYVIKDHAMKEFEGMVV
jgi:hypothetical protein